MLTLEEIMVAPPEPGQVLDFSRLFGNGRPVEMEIGCGKGGFLLERARQHPERNFFGVEWANKYYRYAADRMRRWGVGNVRLMRADAGHLVRHHLPPESITLLHIYHPDPWPKKRHHKRRLIQPPFIAAAADALVTGGRMAVQTDHAEYFEQIRQVLAGQPRLAPTPFDIPEAGIVEGGAGTNFEIKYRREGRQFHRIAVIKT